MTRRIRIIVGISILTLSLIILIWAYKPLDSQTLTQPISPSDMQLPTSVPLHTDPTPVP